MLLGPAARTRNDLSHTFGTLCAASGVPVGDVQHYMGHANLETTTIYMHFAPKADAAQRLTAAFSIAEPARSGGAVAAPGQRSLG
jgi:site-specific recombinase XerC